MQLDRLNVDNFLSEFWQKRPLLIKNPWQCWTNPLEPEELAGLSCEQGAEARLITRTPGGLKVDNGPFKEESFGQLRGGSWTLLVQAVDHHVPAVAQLLQAFRFVPDWRIDDVMVSYATEGGGVGPHFDQYDVFLVQGLGQRRWRLGPACDSRTALLPHDDLRLLASFDPTEEWILEPGDILYVPPAFAHDGVALGDGCMTYSIGFRAPSRAELIGGWSGQMLAEMDEDDRYRDDNLLAQENPGEISAAAIERLHTMVTERMLDRDAFARWFGQHNSIPKYPDVDWSLEQPVDTAKVRRDVQAQVPLCRNPASRFSFVRQGGDCILLFVDGHCFECADETATLAEQLCERDRLEVDACFKDSEAAMDLLTKLVNQGSVAFETKEEGDHETVEG